MNDDSKLVFLESALGNMTLHMREMENILHSLRQRPTCGIGRKPLNIPVKNIYDALHDNTSITEAARKLSVSRGYIYDRIPEPKAHLNTSAAASRTCPLCNAALVYGEGGRLVCPGCGNGSW